MNKHLITCILLVPLVCSCGKQATTSVDTREPLLLNDSLQEIITLDTVRDTPLTNELLLNGRVSFNPERVAHVYPMFGGNVTSVHAEVGDYVGKGDVLAVIRSGEIADIDKQRKEAEHQLAIANRNLEATQDMARSGMASDRDFLQAQQEQADADAETKRIQEMYSIYNITDPSTYVVKAPVSGFIIDKNINRDMQIRSDQGEEMFTISGLDDVWVMADVYEGDISKVKEGMMTSLRSKIGALLVKPALKETLKGFDTSEYGGAPLLGLKGLVVKTHGSSTAKEVSNSIIQCLTFREQRINEKIQECIQADQGSDE